MKAKGWWFLSLAITTAAFTANAESTGAKLLDDTFSRPGGWNQMCAAPPSLPYDVPFPLYTLAVSRFSWLSSQDVSRLQAQRKDVVAVIVDRLHNLDLSKQTPPVISDSLPGQPNPPAPVLSGLLLQAVMELKAFETLPELLRVEADLNQQIEKADKDIKAPLPYFNLESPLLWPVEGAVLNTDHLKNRAQERLYVARIFQRELLSVIATLLRQQKFQPLLSSDIEAHYAEYLLKRQGDSFEIGYSVPSWVSIKDRFMPYTPELRQEIRGFATDFLKQSQEKHNPAPSTAGK